MANKRKLKRKTFVAREDLMKHLSDIAKQRGHSLYETVNEIFELAITAENLDLTLRRIVNERQLFEVARKTGFILGLERLWYEMADLSYSQSKRLATKSWFEAGAWFAKRYATSKAADPIAAFKNDLALFTWNAPEFSIEKKQNSVSTRLVSPWFPESYTFLFASFLEGALEAFGYKITENTVNKGNIHIEAVREETTHE
jgi:hypothetical protein